MKNFIKIKIESVSLHAGEILMAELSENNFYAFEQDENILFAYIEEKDFNENHFKKLLPANTIYTYSIIEDKNWNEEWENNLQPVVINNFVAIRAAFHKPIKNVKHEIIITPKMSFGTGHHPTTFLMIDLMQKINFKNKSVLDFGTGTGVLAILAKKQGAASVVAIDQDEWSIENALENIKANNCNNIIVKQQNNITGISFVDIILANINLNVLKENAKDFSMLLRSGTFLIASGILSENETEIISVFVKNDFIKKKLSQKNKWLALLFQKQ